MTTTVEQSPPPTQSAETLFAWRRAITRSELPATTRLVAFVLSLHMDSNGGSCFPKMATIGLEAGLTEAAARKHVAALVADGWIERTERPGRTPLFKAVHPSCETAPLTSNDTPTSKQHPTPPAKRNPTPSAKQEGRTYLRTCTEDEQLTHAFAAFWNTYPRRIGKPAAMKAFARAAKHAGADTVTSGAARWAQHWNDAQTEPQFIPHPTTWLNRHQWADDPPPVTRPRSRTERADESAKAVAAAVAGLPSLRAIGAAR